MASQTWSPESLGMPGRQNFTLWKDMERAYGFIENHVRHPISGDLDGFLFELLRKRWNLACSDVYEAPPEHSQKSASTSQDNFMSVAPANLTLAGVDKLSLNKRFSDNFKKFADTQIPFTKQGSSGKLFGYGTDGYGTYIPLHLLWPERKNYWGIYISEIGVLNLAAEMYRVLAKGQLSFFPQDEIKQIEHLIQIAYQVVLRHQLFHFKIEQWALLFEFATGRAYYLPYLEYVYLPTIYNSEENNLEEALANTSILLSKKIQKIQKESGLEDTGLVISDFLNRQGPSYRNYELRKGVPPNVKQDDREMNYREVVNFLCNQIIQHDIHPRTLIPYYLYPPNNNFLRAENLCPIYLIRNLTYDAGVIA